MDKDQKPSEQEEKAKAEKRKGLVIARRARRKKTREQAKANGHKLGSKNRKCKRCGILQKSEDFATQCIGKAA